MDILGMIKVIHRPEFEESDMDVDDKVGEEYEEEKRGKYEEWKGWRERLRESENRYKNDLPGFEEEAEWVDMPERNNNTNTTAVSSSASALLIRHFRTLLTLKGSV